LRSNDADPIEDDFDGYENQTGRDAQKSSIGSRAKALHAHPTQSHSQETEAPDFVSFQGELSSIKGER